MMEAPFIRKSETHTFQDKNYEETCTVNKVPSYSHLRLVSKAVKINKLWEQNANERTVVVGTPVRNPCSFCPVGKQPNAFMSLLSSFNFSCTITKFTSQTSTIYQPSTLLDHLIFMKQEGIHIAGRMK